MSISPIANPVMNRSNSADRQTFRGKVHDLNQGGKIIPIETPKPRTGIAIIPMEKAQKQTPSPDRLVDIQSSVALNIPTDQPTDQPTESANQNPANDHTHTSPTPSQPKRTWSSLGGSAIGAASSGAQTTLRTAAWGLGTGLWATKKTASGLAAALRTTASTAGTVYKGVSGYLEGIQPADTQELSDLHQRLSGLDPQSRTARRTLHIRTELNNEHLDILTKLQPIAADLQEVKDACFKSKDHQKNSTDLFSKRLDTLHRNATTQANKLLTTPTNAQAKIAQQDVEALEKELLTITNEIQETSDSFSELQNEIKRTLDLGIALQNSAKATQVNTAALHLNLGWSDWSAYCQELADYCIQTEKPTQATLDRQTEVQQNLAQALTTLSSLKQELKTADDLKADLTQIHKDFVDLRKPGAKPTPKTEALLTLVQAREIDEEQAKSHIQEALEVNKSIHKDFDTAIQLATNAVSYAKRTPTTHMLNLTETFTAQVQSIIDNITSEQVSLTEGSLLNFYKSTAYIAEEVGPDALLAKTASFIEV